MISEQINPVVKKFIVGPLGTNCYVIYEKSSLKGVLIDPGVFDPEIAKYIEENSIKITHTLNTHGHADHILGDAAFGFPVLIHELDEPYLGNSEINLAVWIDVKVGPVKVERLLKDGDIVEVGDLKLEIIHTPGHTPGGITVKVGSLLFTGDTLFFEGIGRTDIPGGSHEEILKSIKEKLMTFPDSTHVFPGHGPETTIGHERENNPYLD